MALLETRMGSKDGEAFDKAFETARQNALLAAEDYARCPVRRSNQ